MEMKSVMLMTVVLFLMQTSMTLGAPADRFKGGSYDGWYQGELLSAPPIWPGYAYPFKGGAYDGYASAGASGRLVWPTLIRFY